MLNKEAVRRTIRKIRTTNTATDYEHQLETVSFLLEGGFAF
jgi:hypothetical protein